MSISKPFYSIMCLRFLSLIIYRGNGSSARLSYLKVGPDCPAHFCSIFSLRCIRGGGGCALVSRTPLFAFNSTSVYF